MASFTPQRVGSEGAEAAAGGSELLGTATRLVSELQQYAWYLNREKKEKQATRKVLAFLENLQQNFESALVDQASRKKLERTVTLTARMFQKVKERHGPLSFVAKNEARKNMIDNDVLAVKRCEYILDPARKAALLSIIESLRQTEEAYEFHSALLTDRSELVQTLENDKLAGGAKCSTTAGVDGALSLETGNEYSKENFAYGSTPFSTFLKLFSSDCIQSTIRGCMGPCAAGSAVGGKDAREFVVFGSSCGWLVFYAALTFGVKSKGYEILRSLVDTSERLLQAEIEGQRLPGGRFVHSMVPPIEFVCEDMLAAPLHNAQIIMLCSQCWDNWLIELVHKKILGELSPGALIVDYNDRLGKNMDAHGKIEEVVSMELAVSWNPSQTFYVYRVRQEG